MLFRDVIGERNRKYGFPSKEGSQLFHIVEIPDVTKLFVNTSGSHRLITLSGKKFIIPTGWLWLEIEADDWSL